MTLQLNNHNDVKRILEKSIFLPSDIFEEIFSCLEKEYSTNPTQLHRTIYSCTWISRNWCQNTIPYLWRKPFYSRRFDNHHNRRLRDSNRKIIETLLTGMNEKERKELLLVGLDLPEKGKFGSVFDYASFIKDLDYFEMLNSIVDWTLEKHLHITNECIRQEYFYQRGNASTRNDNGIDGLIHLITFSLMRMFKNHNARFHSLKLIPYTINDYIKGDDCYISLVDQNKCLIENLKYLEVDTDFCDDLFLISLSKISDNLKYLHASRDNIRIITTSQKNVKPQATILKCLISSQQNLESLKLSGYIWYSNLMNQSISTQVNSLKSLEFNEIEFKLQHRQLDNCLDTIKSCINLESLIINWCWGLDREGGGNQRFIASSKFPKLSKVIIKGFCSNSLRKWAEAYN